MDREDEVAELRSRCPERPGRRDLRSAPLRECLLAWRTAQELVRACVAQVDLMTTPRRRSTGGEAGRSRSTRTSRWSCSGRRSGSRCSAAFGSRPPSRSDPRTGRWASASSPQPPEDVDATLGLLGSSPRQTRAQGRVRCRTSSRRWWRSIRPAEAMRLRVQEQPDAWHVYLGSKRHHDGADLQRERALLEEREADRGLGDSGRPLFRRSHRRLTGRPARWREMPSMPCSPSRRASHSRSCATRSGRRPSPRGARPTSPPSARWTQF